MHHRNQRLDWTTLVSLSYAVRQFLVVVQPSDETLGKGNEEHWGWTYDYYKAADVCRLVMRKLLRFCAYGINNDDATRTSAY